MAYVLLRGSKLNVVLRAVLKSHTLRARADCHDTQMQALILASVVQTAYIRAHARHSQSRSWACAFAKPIMASTSTACIPLMAEPLPLWRRLGKKACTLVPCRPSVVGSHVTRVRRGGSTRCGQLHTRHGCQPAATRGLGGQRRVRHDEDHDVKKVLRNAGRLTTMRIISRSNIK